MSKELVMIMAGGKGDRLYPLSKDRAKPAVPFGGRYRVIDFALSNFTNSGFYHIKVLTQFKSDSLNRHISTGWKLATQLDHYVDIVPPQMRVNTNWYLGTADAIYQNINLILDENPDYVFVFGGDHVYKMDIRQMLEFHIQKDADVTVSAVPIPLAEATQMGVIEIDPERQIKSFLEKPENPQPMPGSKTMALASMGNYIFKRDVLLKMLFQDHENESSAHDFGKNILPQMLGKFNVCAYDFSTNTWPGREDKETGYWCDIGTIDAYWEANMDLCSVTPRLNLYNPDWPIRTTLHHYPPVKFVFANEKDRRVGQATDSLVSEGCIISGGHVHKCVLSPGVRINSYADVAESIMMEGVDIGRHCKIKKAIIDKDIHIPPKTIIGYDLEEDRKNYHVTKSGIVVIPKKEKTY